VFHRLFKREEGTLRIWKSHGPRGSFSRVFRTNPRSAIDVYGFGCSRYAHPVADLEGLGILSDGQLLITRCFSPETMAFFVILVAVTSTLLPNCHVRIIRRPWSDLISIPFLDFFPVMYTVEHGLHLVTAIQFFLCHGFRVMTYHYRDCLSRIPHLPWLSNY
jgi:hypothetical protein